MPPTAPCSAASTCRRSSPTCASAASGEIGSLSRRPRRSMRYTSIPPAPNDHSRGREERGMNQIIGGTTIRLHQQDNVVVAAQAIPAGATMPSEGVVTASAIPSGHKIATREIAAGDFVRKYNQIIGVATSDIAPGQHVHVQNCAMSEFERDYAFCADMRPTQYFKDRATFQGIVREDGRVATRNFIGVLTTVNCSATVAKRVATAFENVGREASANVDCVA